MNAKTAGEVALKVWAVILVVSALLFAPVIVQQLATAATESTRGGAATWRIAAASTSFQLVFSVLVAMVVFRLAGKIASSFGTDEPETSSPMNAVTLQTVAFGVVGVYFLVVGIRQCGGILFQVVLKPAFEQDTLGYIWRDQQQKLIEAAVQTICGLVLVIGRGRLAAAWARLRGFSDTES